MNINSIESAIRKVYGLIRKESPSFKLDICEEIVNKAPKKSVKPFIFIDKKNNVVGYINENGKKFKAVCSKEDKFDIYIGASLVLGYAEYGNKRKYYKILGFDSNDKEIELASLVNSYTRFGGKENFKKMVDELITTKKPNESQKEEVAE